MAKFQIKVNGVIIIKNLNKTVKANENKFYETKKITKSTIVQKKNKKKNIENIYRNKEEIEEVENEDNTSKIIITIIKIVKLIKKEII